MEGCRHQYSRLLMIAILPLALVFPSSSLPATRRFHFNVQWKKVTRLCHTKPLLTVNGKYPGPTIAVHEGDNVQVQVTNLIATNTTIHWHGIRQMRTGWADGPAYITQCPIRGGQTYTYKFSVVDHRGTLLWHAHYSWQRVSVHGAFIIYPRMPYPFKPPNPIQDELPIILGEWWNKDADEVEKEMMRTGDGPENSEAYTINGMPGPLYPCSNKDTFIQTVVPGKTYLLRIINAALTAELFFAIANHTLTVVEIDGLYTKPFTTTAIMIAPGQTTNVLLTAHRVPDSSALFPMAATAYISSIFPFDNSTAMAFLSYKPFKTLKKLSSYSLSSVPNLPQIKDTAFAAKFTGKLRSLASDDHPCKVPKTIDKRIITTVSLNLQDCPANQTCQGYIGKRFFASMNNQSFTRPLQSILGSHYKNLTNRIFSSDFPEKPPAAFDYTGIDPLTSNMNAQFGTKLLVVPYGINLEIVMQGTSFLSVENHPIHFHGHNFFIVGWGIGNFDVRKDPQKYNLVDPPERNTVGVPAGGWAAIRFKADNPGVWFVHCHLEEHTSWGLAMALVVQNGANPSQCLLPPPDDLPSC